MVGVKNQHQIQGVDEVGFQLVLFAGYGEHHAEEVLAVSQVVLWIDERLANRLLVAEGRNGVHLGHHAVNGQFHLTGIAGIERVLTVDRQRADHGTQNGHGMGVRWEAGEDRLHPLVQQRVRTDVGTKMLELLAVG